MDEGRGHYMNIKRPFYYICNLDLFISIVSMIILIALTFAGVVMRYVFNDPFKWGEEVQLSLFVWVIYFGGCAAFRYKGHIAVEILLDLFPKRMQNIASVIIYIISFCVLLYLFVNSCLYVIQQYNNQRITEILKLKRAYIFLALPVGTFLMIVNMSVMAFKEMIVNKRQKEYWSEPERE